MTRPRPTVTYVYETFIPSRDYDSDMDDSTFQTGDFVDDVSDSIPFESVEDTGNWNEQNLEEYGQHITRDRVNDATKQPHFDGKTGFPTKTTPEKANEYTERPDDDEDTVIHVQRDTAKLTEYTKQTTPKGDSEHTENRKIEADNYQSTTENGITTKAITDKSEDFQQEVVTDMKQEAIISAAPQENRKVDEEKYQSPAENGITTKASIDNASNDENYNEDFKQGGVTDMKNPTTEKHESITSTTQPELERMSPKFLYNDEEIDSEPKSPKKDKGMKTLLWYDTQMKSMRGHTTTLGFSQCEYNNCQYKSFLSKSDPKPSKPFDADAILIQSAGIYDLSPPPRRDENQVFVLAVRDAFPRTTAERDPGMGMKWIDLFNWTMTYRLDSDIVYKYANILEKENKTELADKNYDKIFDEKVDNAVWFVSHCKTSSMREHYVRKMQSVMGVDIFGGCGVPPPCPKRSDNIGQCIDDIAMKYKYYLAFENTLVEDYITEKVYRWFNRDIIVVARGGSNYSRILPPGTFVDAGDFASAVELGKYLKELARDKKRYTDILKRKDNFYSSHKFVPAQEANCKLCEYLNNLDEHRNSYDNIIKWWLKNWKNDDFKPTPLKGWPMRSNIQRKNSNT